MVNMRFFEVGGCVRDAVIGRASKDIDFSVEVESFDAMRAGLIERGYEIFVESPQFFTIRAHHPDSRDTFDFVMCRKESEYTDGRHPDIVEPGSIFDDLARRDFTMNAIAKDADGNFIDPHGGVSDIKRRTIRCVGNPIERFTEDGLRVIRAVRFAVVLGFYIDNNPASEYFPTKWAMSQPVAIKALGKVSVERIREELEKAFRFDTPATFRLLEEIGATDVVFSRGLRANATMKG